MFSTPFPGIHILIRTVVLTAVAALAFTAPAQAAGVRVALSGKSTAQVEAEVTKAAKTVCFRETRSETLALEAYTRCVKATTEVAMGTLSTAQIPSSSTMAAN